jgi:phenylpyruvate tautomerase PptA (4-oxalocrotonate tautomerase family)
MPVTEINIAKGNDKRFLRQLIDCVHSVLVQIIEIPQNDKNIRLKEFEPDFFDTKEPYKIFIEITLFSGRTIETKKELY